jgi:hypothetical protein
MRALGLDRVIAEAVRVRERASGYTETEKVEALVLLLAAGGTCLDDITLLRADAGLMRLLGRRLPAADTLRHLLYACHADQLLAQAQAARPQDTVASIPAETAALQGLARVTTALVHGVAARGHPTAATLDHDATIQESHKREALPHYQGGRGYQPAATYWAEQDLVLADEYRDGNVPAGMANLPLIQRGFASLPATVTAYFFRADSACYDERILRWLADPQRPGGPPGPIGFTISADMSVELHRACAAVPEAAWTLFADPLQETVSLTEVEFTPGDWPKTAWPPPCGRFGANAAWYRLSLLTYNVLSALKSLALPAHLSAARPKRLRFALFTLPGRLVTRAGRLILRLSAEAERLVGLIAARTRLAALQPCAASG